ncbi:MAG: F0F1 ATP synthase subunit epsilon [Candidatus Eisenbacteria bacterium]|nr:F0F1 ATP synthase subunit epsilon [Candidatus Eisenbacteria bacterium]
MAATFRIRLLTPERSVLEKDIVHLQARGSEGFLGILAHHAPLLTALAPGPLTIRKVDGNTEVFAVSGGMLEVSNNQATVLADAVERAGEIDVERALAAMERARRRLAERAPGLDAARAEAALGRALNRVRVARTWGATSASGVPERTL